MNTLPTLFSNSLYNNYDAYFDKQGSAANNTFKTDPVIELFKTHSTSPLRIIGYDNTYTINLGKGYNALTNVTVNQALSDDNKLIIPNPVTSLRTTFSIQLIENTTQLRESLSISASSSFSGASGGYGRFDFFSSKEVDTYQVYLLIKVSTIGGLTGLKKHVFDDASTAKLINSDPLKFYQLYGTHFISGIALGGEFYALVTYSSKTEFEKYAISAELRYNTGAWDSSGSFKQSLESIKKFKSTNARIARWGTNDALPDPRNIDAVINYALSFPSNFAGAQPSGQGGVQVYFTIDEYSSVIGLPKNTNYDLSEQIETINYYASLQDTLREKKNSIVFALNNSKYFEKFDTKSLNTALATIDNFTISTLQHIKTLQKNPFTKTAPPTINLPALGPSPKLKPGVLVPLRIDYTVLANRFQEQPGSASDLSWTVPADSTSILTFIVYMQDAIGDLGIEYMVHVADHGDAGWYQQGNQTFFRSHQGIAFRLTGVISKYFDVYYQGKLAGAPDTAICINGQFCGTRGQRRPLRSFRLWIQAKPIPVI